MTLKTMEMPLGIIWKTLVGASAASMASLAVSVRFGVNIQLMDLNRLTQTFHPGFRTDGGNNGDWTCWRVTTQALF